VNTLLANLAERSAFDEVIDVRTPLEYADDHIPGAINAPVLSNEERVIVGTMYKLDPFGATRLGAAMVARNIAHHLETLFQDRPPKWRPLIYCWRGGKRSGSMTQWFNLIGWRARQLQGGYKTYRQWVLQALETRPAELRYVVLGGLTGCGKTRLLHALSDAGAQALDLEGLAQHRGSLLGRFPDAPQPSQKYFETRLIETLDSFDPARPVFVEAESKRIGLLRLPQSLVEAMQRAPRVGIEASRASRLAFLCEDYRHLMADPAWLKAQLDRLTALHRRETLARWYALIDAGAIADLFGELIDLHYDPAYRRSSPDRGQPDAAQPRMEIDPMANLDGAARELMRRFS